MKHPMFEIAELAIAVDAAIQARYQAKKTRASLFRQWNDVDGFYDSSVLGDDKDPEIEAAISAYKKASSALMKAKAKLSKVIRSTV